MDEKRVLIVTYYWPPSGGSGVQRWLKFVKYLPQFGWQPYVFTPENPAFNLKDESLLKDIPPEAEVLHFPIWEPYSIFNKFSNNKATSANSAPKPTTFFNKISIWIRGNFFIPDPRVFWVRPSVKFLDSFLREQGIRTIITTGPPHSVHLIGLRLKRKNPSLHWIADFRDPWSEWGFLDTIRVGTFARRIHIKLERSVLQQASVVTTITPFYVRQFERLGQRKVKLLTNGFDEDDFSDMVIQHPDKFVIRHVGIVNDLCNPVPFMEAVASLCKENNDFYRQVQIDFVGQVNSSFKNFVEHHPVLQTITTFSSPVPHKEVIHLYEMSVILLLILTGYKDAEGYMPGKLFEYLATGLPVIGIGPENGDAANLLKETRANLMIDGDNSNAIKEALLRHFNDWQSNTTPTSSAVNQYSRKSITEKLVILFK
jgi:glycosyltransferase involved in cell wall biosynthesis